MDLHLFYMTQLIFLPGASGSTQFWYPLIETLTPEYNDNYKIIAYPGFGSAPVDRDLNSFEELSQLVVEQIDQPCILIAQSMGGIFAVVAALEKPHLVQGLVLIATSGGIDLTKFDVADWRKSYLQEFLNYPDWFITTKVNYEERLAEIKQQVLLIWGDHDPISPVAIGEYLQRKLTDARLKIIQGGQHDLANKHAIQVSSLILDYFQSIKSELEC